MVRVMSVVPSTYWPPESITEVQPGWQPTVEQIADEDRCGHVGPTTLHAPGDALVRELVALERDVALEELDDLAARLGIEDRLG